MEALVETVPHPWQLLLSFRRDQEQEVPQEYDMAIPMREHDDLIPPQAALGY